MNLKNNLSELRRTGKLKYVIIILALGIILMLIGSFVGKKDETAAPSSASVSETEYQTFLENKIKTLCENVAGVSDVTVAVSLDGGYEYVYATDGSDDYVLVGSGAERDGILLEQKLPKIAGIGIVCAGGGDPKIKYELLSLISAACGVGTNKIFITEAQK